MMKITAILSPKPTIQISYLRHLSQLVAKSKEVTDEKMQAWQIHAYGGTDELKLTQANIPVLSSPSDIIIQVDASSVNPIDVAMMNGYGAKTVNFLREIKSCVGRPYSDIEFPLTLGRDFAGTVVSKGQGVDRLQVGDEVWGVIPIEQQGCHANYVMVENDLVNLRPKNLTHTEAASILYAGLTAWSALWYSGNLWCNMNLGTRMTNRRVLVLGGSGGVGTLAIQLLRAWNMEVITTCSSDATDMLQNLGADAAINYNESDADSQVIAMGPYHIILDCSNQGPEIIKAKGYPCHSYITLNSPVLKNADEYGLLLGFVKNMGDFIQHRIDYNKLNVNYGFFVPSPTGINLIQNLVEKNQIKPVVQEIFPFDDLPKAYERVSEGHLRGKVVIDMR